MAENQKSNDEPLPATAKSSQSQTANTENSKSPRKRKRPGKRNKNVEHGESLSEFDEREWDQGEVALGAEMINMKKKQNKPTVYRATGQQNAASSVSRKRTSRKSKERKTIDTPPPLDKADMIGQLVANVIRMFMQGKKDEDLQMEIRLIDTGGKLLDLTNYSATPTASETEILKPNAKEQSKPANLDQRGGEILREP